MSQLHWSSNLAIELEHPWLTLVPGFLSRWLYFDNARQQVGAVLLAAHIALSKNTTTIVLGCARTQSHPTLSSKKSKSNVCKCKCKRHGGGGGGVLLADMGITARLLFKAASPGSIAKNPCKRILMVDCTPQMTIGLSHDFYAERQAATSSNNTHSNDTASVAPSVFIVDIFSTNIWPYDPMSESKEKDTANLSLPWSTEIEKNKMHEFLPKALQDAVLSFQPSLILARIGMEENADVKWTVKDITRCWQVLSRTVSAQQVPLVLLLGDDPIISRKINDDATMEIVKEALSDRLSSVDRIRLKNWGAEEEEEEGKEEKEKTTEVMAMSATTPLTTSLTTKEIPKEDLKLEEFEKTQEVVKNNNKGDVQQHAPKRNF